MTKRTVSVPEVTKGVCGPRYYNMRVAKTVSRRNPGKQRMENISLYKESTKLNISVSEHTWYDLHNSVCL